jgi:hypothetical protein
VLVQGHPGHVDRSVDVDLHAAALPHGATHGRTHKHKHLPAQKVRSQRKGCKEVVALLLAHMPTYQASSTANAA